MDQHSDNGRGFSDCLRSSVCVPARNTSVPLLSLSLEVFTGVRAICHMAHSHTSTAHAAYTALEAEIAHTNNGASALRRQQVRRARTRTHTHFLPPNPRELIHSCYSNIKVITHAVKGEKARSGGEIERTGDGESGRGLAPPCSCLFFSILGCGAVCARWTPECVCTHCVSLRVWSLF